MRKLSENEANVALAHSLLQLVYAILKEGRAYQEPDPAQMHELEKAKLIRHHTKRLRELGADDELIAELVAQLTAPPACSSAEEKQTAATTPQRIVKACPPRVCRGALGFRARQTRKQEYSVIKQPAAEAPSQARPTSKRNKPSRTQPPQVE